MRAFYVLILLCTPLFLIGQNRVAQDVMSVVEDGRAFSKWNPLKFETDDLNTRSISSSVLTKGTLMTIDQSSIQELFVSSAPFIKMNVPATDRSDLNLLLMEHDFLAEDFEVYAASNPAFPHQYTPGKYYYGIIEGDESSVVSISVFNDEIRGIIANSEGNYVLGKLENNTEGVHILYNDKDLNALPEGSCETPDDGIPYKDKDLKYQPQDGRSPGDCIKVYVEVDHDIYNDKGSVTAASNFTTGLFNESITLYANDGIIMVVSEIKVWDTPSPYSSTSSSGMLSDFQNNTGSFNGNLAHLISYQASGGIAAGFDGVCNSNPDNSKCFSSIDATYANVPAYSWSVMVVTHEMGHLIGSRHTHACVWNGNNTAIDGCAGSTEGSCSNPGNPSGQGTIMSYCHLTVGIDLALGFGPQPAAVLQNTVNNASCTSACGPPTCTDGIQNGNETGVDCGGPDCDPCPTCTDGVQNGDETGVDCGGSSCPACPCTGQNVTLTIVLDNYPEETSWNITNGGGSVVASGGTYGSQPDGSTVIEVNCLNDGCYDFNIFDSYGDGICCGYGQGSYVLEDENGTTLASGGSFGSSETTNFCLSGSGPTCTDGIQNGNETGVDCGGPDCPACPTCNDGVQNGDETDVDCGGPDCPACPTCSDGIQNGDETGVDCGGSVCPDCPSGGCTPASSTYSFESGWQSWQDGGSDCARVNSSTRSWDGSYSIRIRDNSGSASATTSPAYDLSEYSSVSVEFYFYMNSMEYGEDFWLRYNDGSGWQTIATWARGDNISNNTFYTTTVTLNSGLTSNAQFRFQCDASSNADRVYIDLVTISGNCSSLPEAGVEVVTNEVKEKPKGHAPELGLEPQNDDISVYPNPSRDMVNISTQGEITGLRVMNANGNLVQNVNVEQGNRRVDISNLPSGLYILMIEKDGIWVPKRFMKL